MGGEIREMKRQLRKAVKGAVASLTAEERQRQSESVFGELKRVVEARGAQTILAFWSMPDEIPTVGWRAFGRAAIGFYSPWWLAQTSCYGSILGGVA